MVCIIDALPFFNSEVVTSQPNKSHPILQYSVGCNHVNKKMILVDYPFFHIFSIYRANLSYHYFKLLEERRILGH